MKWLALVREVQQVGVSEVVGVQAVKVGVGVVGVIGSADCSITA